MSDKECMPHVILTLERSDWGRIQLQNFTGFCVPQNDDCQKAGMMVLKASLRATSYIKARSCGRPRSLKPAVAGDLAAFIHGRRTLRLLQLLRRSIRGCAWREQFGQHVQVHPKRCSARQLQDPAIPFQNG